MRRAGVVAAVNTPPPPERDEPRETQVKLCLRLKAPQLPAAADSAGGTGGGRQLPGKQTRRSGHGSGSHGGGTHGGRHGGVAAAKGSNAFHVDLSRFRSVLVIRAERIGPAGGVALARDLSRGCCPALRHLLLPYNGLSPRGAAALLEAFAGGAGAAIEALDLSANGLGPAAVAALGRAIAAGGLPRLSAVELGGNKIGDEGAKIFAHQVLGGVWCGVAEVGLAGCGIRDAGLLAVFSAVTATGVDIPRLQRLSLRANSASLAARQRMAPTPRFWAA
ncbi:unnamed protein product [Phaeothamnion confervicola]